MNINATLLGQMITFVLFVAFTMKFIWPHIIQALEERQAKIADGLAAGERGRRELELAQQKAVEQLREGKDAASTIVEKAHLRASQIVEEAESAAKEKGKQLLEQAEANIQQEVVKAKLELRKQVAAIVVSGAQKILGRQIDEAANSDLIDELIEEL